MTAPRHLRVLASPAFTVRHVQPYNHLLYSNMPAEVEVVQLTRRRLLVERYDVIHVHWPEFPLMATSFLTAATRSMLMLVLYRWARLRGARLVWTAHDLAPHEVTRPRLSRFYWNAFLRQVDGYISLSQTGLELVRQRFPVLAGKPSCVTPHGHYRSEYANTLTRAEARHRLGIDPDAGVVTFFGMIRPYKNVPALIRAFGAMDAPDAALVVAGMPNSDEMEDEVRRAAASVPGVHLHLGHVPADEVQVYVNAADLVVAPYAEIFNSGTALLALSFDRPILVPAKGSLVELQAAVGERWVHTFDGSLDEVALGKALEAARAGAGRDGGDEGGGDEGVGADGPDLSSFEWEPIAQRTARFYAEVVAAPHRH